MNKSDLVSHVAEQAEITKAASALAVDAVFETISSSLADGEDVAIFGFGTFKVMDRAARTARNPITGDSVKVPAKKAAKFVVAKALKDSLNPAKGSKKKK